MLDDDDAVTPRKTRSKGKRAQVQSPTPDGPPTRKQRTAVVDPVWPTLVLPHFGLTIPDRMPVVHARTTDANALLSQIIRGR